MNEPNHSCGLTACSRIQATTWFSTTHRCRNPSPITTTGISNSCQSCPRRPNLNGALGSTSTRRPAVLLFKRQGLLRYKHESPTRMAEDIEAGAHWAELCMRDILHLRQPDGDCLVAAVLTVLQTAELEERARNRMLHSQRGFNVASTTRTFPADHRHTLARVGLRR